jgi:hypothetical protein
MSITAVLLPFVTYLLTLPHSYELCAKSPVTSPNPIYSHSIKLWQYDCVKLSQ